MRELPATAVGESTRRRHLYANVAPFSVLTKTEGRLGRARSDTRHARGAFNSSDLHELIHRQIGRTRTRAFSAVDAGLSVSADLTD